MARAPRVMTGREQPPRHGRERRLSMGQVSTASAGCLMSRGLWSGDIRLLSQLPNLEACQPRGRKGDEQLAAMVPLLRPDGEGSVDVSKTRMCGDSPSSPRALNPGATETSVALCRVAATPGSAGGFSQSMEAEMESRAKRRWRADVHQQHGRAHVSPRRSLLGVRASLHWPR